MPKSTEETMMKISIPVQKPRAQEVNAILVSKRCARHKDPRRPSRSQLKQNLMKAMND